MRACLSPAEALFPMSAARLSVVRLVSTIQRLAWTETALGRVLPLAKG